jgi:hypothetical protein
MALDACQKEWGHAVYIWVVQLSFTSTDQNFCTSYIVIPNKNQKRSKGNDSVASRSDTTSYSETLLAAQLCHSGIARNLKSYPENQGAPLIHQINNKDGTLYISGTDFQLGNNISPNVVCNITKGPKD